MEFDTSEFNQHMEIMQLGFLSKSVKMILCGIIWKIVDGIPGYKIFM